MKNPELSYTTFKVPHWKIPVTVSVLIHLLVVLIIFLAPDAKKVQEKPLFTRLVTPNEWMTEFPGERPRPSDLPPKHLYGGGRGSSKPRAEIPREEKPLRESRAIPVPLPAQPPATTSERTAPSSDTADRSLADRGPSTQRRSDDSAAQKGDATARSPKSAGIPAPSPSLRERLFDRDIVGKIAKREEKTHDNTITFDTGEFRYEGYMNKLKEKIESIWRYPHDAARRGIQGDLKIRFTIRRNGKLDDVEVVRTSGYRALDEAAVQALKDGDPFWPLPEDWGKDSLTITGHFIYSLYGTYVR